MKKIYMFVLFGFLVVNLSNGQEFTSKKGIPILPETGEYGLSVDAVPFLEYLGNLFHGTDATYSPYWSFPGLGSDIPMYTLQAKRIMSPTMAYRGRVRLGYMLDSKKNSIMDQSSPTEMVDDKWTRSVTNVVLGAGIEKRRGKGRVQGYIGAMANIIISSRGDKYTYGNPFDSAHPSPTSTMVPWTSDGSGGYITESESSSRPLKVLDGFMFGIGANGFVGVEYFFAPKISIGGEFSWGFILETTGKSKVETESWDGKSAVTKTVKRGGSTFFGIDNYNTGGAINLAFYF